MTQIEWRRLQKGNATALDALLRDALMPLTGVCYDTVARLETQAGIAGAAVLTADVSLCVAHCFARAEFRGLGKKSLSVTAYH
jgi:hypothetical protein